jgi:primosomal protein N' (replication factor Y) (superfamily II helicase)
MKSTDHYIEVAVALPVYRTFTYSVPEPFGTVIAAGKRILVPFGRRRVTGYVLGASQPPVETEIKSVLDVLDEQPLFPLSMVPFFRWIADYYKYPIGAVVKNALPAGLNVHDDRLVSITEKGRDALKNGQLTPTAHQILNCLSGGALREKELNKKANQRIPTALLYILEERGWIEQKWELRGIRSKARLERTIRLAGIARPVEHLSLPKRKIIEVLTAEGEISIKKLKESVPTAAALIKPLEREGYLSTHTNRVYRDPFGESIKPDTPPTLNREQQAVVSDILAFLNTGYATFLLHGVTGSGKTEVYMQAAAEVLGNGRSVLVLVPEIALITQMERCFRARFGECVAVLHSGLSAGERYDQWCRIINAKATVAVGTRSAIFAPFDNIGMIIVDEEHESSYKQDSALRYNARDLAVVRAKQNQCLALLGSATPSVQSYYNVKTNKFRELILSQRFEHRPLPTVRIVDLRQHRDTRGVRRFITPVLHQEIQTTLVRGEQVLLFLNRRGFASFPVCGACGQPMRCQHCDISLTLHQRANAYRCHYCGFSRPGTSSCDTCGSTKIKLLGIGTEKLETNLASLYPGARIARMDSDTTTRKGSILKLLKGLRNQTIDILVGTQMVAKGHDFPNITLVGIICADLSLSFPDFRAGERTFQLLAQVAGRAGRGDRPGRVILQTYNPEHFAIVAAQSQDFDSFYRQEIQFRKALDYPPYARMIQLNISGKHAEKTESHARLWGEFCRELKSRSSSFSAALEILGPIEASLAKIADKYRWQILLKSLNARALHYFINQLLYQNSPRLIRPDIHVSIDVDPFFMM